jgi:hypothetical protein
MEREQEASVGRIVHFYPAGAHKRVGAAEFYAAIVVEVLPEIGANAVSLWTFGPGSLYFHQTVYPRRLADEGGAFWDWPPPRVGQ